VAEDMKIKIRSVFELVKTLQDTGQVEVFIKYLEDRGGYVSVNMDVINAVKGYFALNALHETTPFGKTIEITMNAATLRPDPGCQGGHCGHTYGF